MKTRRKKRPLTLLEIMIVIMLIGLIGSVIGINMKGSLDEGRAFKTRKAQAQIRDILMLEVAKGAGVEEVVAAREQYLENSGLVKNGKKFLKDGWGQEFAVSTNKSGKISVTSKKLDQYLQKKRDKGIAVQEEDDDD